MSVVNYHLLHREAEHAHEPCDVKSLLQFSAYTEPPGDRSKAVRDEFRRSRSLSDAWRMQLGQPGLKVNTARAANSRAAGEPAREQSGMSVPHVCVTL